jgi:glucokinase
MGYTREDGVHLAPNVPGWESLRLPVALRRAFPGVPLALDNDVRAAAKAELRWGALAGVTTGLYVNLGTGVAATLIVDGKPLVGSHGAAGEIGYWVVPRRQASDRTVIDTEDCSTDCSTLEAEVGGVGVRSRARSIGVEGSMAELLASRSPSGRALVRDVLRLIASSITNLAILIDPEKIVLGGGYTRAGDTLLDVIRDSLRKHTPFPPEVTVGRFGSDAGLYGAVALAESAGERGT